MLEEEKEQLRLLSRVEGNIRYENLGHIAKPPAAWGVRVESKDLVHSESGKLRRRDIDSDERMDSLGMVLVFALDGKRCLSLTQGQDPLVQLAERNVDVVIELGRTAFDASQKDWTAEAIRRSSNSVGLQAKANGREKSTLCLRIERPWAARGGHGRVSAL